MEKNKFITVNYKGSKIEVLLSDNYKSFIENIKRKLNLSSEDCNKMSFKFFFKSENAPVFEFDVKGSDEYDTALIISNQYNDIYSVIILPKPKSIPQSNIIKKKTNLTEEDKLIEELKQKKKDLIKEYLAIRRKNIDLTKELNEDSEKKENYEEVMNRFKIIEESEQYQNVGKGKNKAKKLNIPEKIKIKNEKQEILDCEFIDNNNEDKHTISKKINEIKIQNQIYYDFRVRNNGQKEWPNDTLLKCETTDSPIYFYYSSLTDNNDKVFVDQKGGVIQNFRVIIIFKNYNNIKVGEYKLKAYLVSDKHGRIGKDYGVFTLKVLPKDNYLQNSNEFNILNNDYYDNDNDNYNNKDNHNYNFNDYFKEDY